ncbi:hypothetical protein D8B26_002144 [Coccidioides posadasii str. Silveira]|uniref:uncharacterized protein n=1 Tax=Coccidioides posadasii (strain RMSCC 757 / Silveira) TaxID=443226 RepID=UPI001BF04ECD|nr:hypothetical protein D8B26_002144 [Coccidioides posadasii str. Silveira]
MPIAPSHMSSVQTRTSSPPEQPVSVCPLGSSSRRQKLVGLVRPSPHPPFSFHGCWPSSPDSTLSLPAAASPPLYRESLGDASMACNFTWSSLDPFRNSSILVTLTINEEKFSPQPFAAPGCASNGIKQVLQ